MKIIGIEISGREVRMVVLERDANNEIKDITNSYKPISLEDDTESENVILFKNTLFATLDSFSPDVIMIKYRNPNGKGMRAPSPLSFKIEGLIQLYTEAEIGFTKPQTIAAFYKKNKLDLKAKYVYQADALKIAFHYLRTH